MNTEVIRETNFDGIGKPKRGKVRDIYDLDPFLLLVATDRLSAYDVVMAEPIPHKGNVLNKLSTLWFSRLADIIPNHFITCMPLRYTEACQPYQEQLKGRSMLVKKTIPLPVECVVRGYLSGSAWTAYMESRSICGIPLQTGLVESQELPEAIFTPAGKAEQGHDENITFEQAEKILGRKLAQLVKEKSLTLYAKAQKLALAAGIIIADTKFEFGLDENGQLLLIDEALTPDSSRFWPEDSYKPGGPQKSFDKQFVRDYLKSLGWNKQPPPPHLPEPVVLKTSAKYLEAYERLERVLH